MFNGSKIDFMLVEGILCYSHDTKNLNAKGQLLQLSEDEVEIIIMKDVRDKLFKVVFQ